MGLIIRLEITWVSLIWTAMVIWKLLTVIGVTRHHGTPDNDILAIWWPCTMTARLCGIDPWPVRISPGQPDTVFRARLDPTASIDWRDWDPLLPIWMAMAGRKSSWVLPTIKPRLREERCYLAWLRSNGIDGR